MMMMVLITAGNFGSTLERRACVGWLAVVRLRGSSWRCLIRFGATGEANDGWGVWLEMAASSNGGCVLVACAAVGFVARRMVGD